MGELFFQQKFYCHIFILLCASMKKESQLSTLIIPLQFYDLERRRIATDTQIEAELVLL